MVWAYALGSVSLVSLISLAGILFLVVNRVSLEKILLVIVSFAIGALAGNAFIHLIPEAFAGLGIELATSLLIILGMILFFSLEKFIRWRHCHVLTSSQHLHPVATLNLIGDGIHNLIDGIIIGASYLVSIPLGIATTLAIVLHEIPQEIGDFGILVHAGFSVRKALMFNFASALLAVVGTILVLAIGPYVREFSLLMLPITAGGFIYIAGSDLIPEIQRSCTSVGVTLLQLVFIILGIGLMVLVEYSGR